MRRAAASSPGTGALPTISSTTSRADAGPVEMPHGPWPEQTNRLVNPATAPINGRRSNERGRAQTRTRVGWAPSKRGQEARRRCRAGAPRAPWDLAADRGMRTRCRSPMRAVTALNSCTGCAPSLSIPSSSRTARGAISRSTVAMTPHSGRIGDRSFQPGTTSDVHGPAATSTCPASMVLLPTRTPVT